MRLFKRSLKFKNQFFEFFDTGYNFTIRRGIDIQMDRNEYFYLVNTRYGTRKLARHIKTQVMRFCDIPCFDRWHMNSRILSKTIDTMELIYPEFDKEEIVTVIWFQVC